MNTDYLAGPPLTGSVTWLVSWQDPGTGKWRRARMSLDALASFVENRLAAREAAQDQALAGEVTARKAADAAQVNRDAAQDAALTVESATRQAADATEVGARQAAVSAEAAARQTADASEVAGRQAADTAESTARVTADTGLTGRVAFIEAKPEEVGHFTATGALPALSVLAGGTLVLSSLVPAVVGDVLKKDTPIAVEPLTALPNGVAIASKRVTADGVVTLQFTATLAISSGATITWAISSLK